MTMRVLLLTQRFHPARAVGAVRWTALSEALADLDTEVRVICRRQPGEGTDPSVRVELALRRGQEPDSGTPTPPVPPSDDRPAAWGARARRSISNLAIPDTAALAWWRRRHAVLAAARRAAPEVIVSTSPPHGIHLLAGWLSRQLATPLIIDFRDPYVGDSRYDRPGLPPWRQLNARLERRLIGRADAILTASDDHHRDLQARYPNRASVIRHIPNGYYPAPTIDPENIEPGPSRPVLAVVGRAPMAELATVVEAARRHWSGESLRLMTVGLPEAHISQLRSMVPVEDYGWTSDHELATVLAKATMLTMVLSEHRGSGGGTSTKLYPYLDSGKPILAVNPKAADLQLLHRWSRFRALYQPNVHSALAALAELDAPPEGSAKSEGDGNQMDLAAFRDRYRWEAVAEQVRDVIADVVERRTPESGPGSHILLDGFR